MSISAADLKNVRNIWSASFQLITCFQLARQVGPGQAQLWRLTWLCPLIPYGRSEKQFCSLQGEVGWNLGPWPRLLASASRQPEASQHPLTWPLFLWPSPCLVLWFFRDSHYSFSLTSPLRTRVWVLNFGTKHLDSAARLPGPLYTCLDLCSSPPIVCFW